MLLVLSCERFSRPFFSFTGFFRCVCVLAHDEVHLSARNSLSSWSPIQTVSGAASTKVAQCTDEARQIQIHTSAVSYWAVSCCVVDADCDGPVECGRYRVEGVDWVLDTHSFASYQYVSYHTASSLLAWPEILFDCLPYPAKPTFNPSRRHSK